MTISISECQCLVEPVECTRASSRVLYTTDFRGDLVKLAADIVWDPCPLSTMRTF